MRNIYLIGSLRNEKIPQIAKTLREAGYSVFDDWHAAGEFADDSWRDYEKSKGHNLAEALNGYAACHVFDFDVHHLNRCDTGILVMPAGKSGHTELGYMRGLGKDCAILLEEEPDRFDVMLKFANLGVYYNIKDLLNALGRHEGEETETTSGEEERTESSDQKE